MSVPALRDGLRSSAGEPAGIPSFLDALFGTHRQWVLEAEYAKPELDKLKWVIEKSSGIENPSTVVKLFDLCHGGRAA